MGNLSGWINASANGATLEQLGLRSFASGWPSALLLTLTGAVLIMGAALWTDRFGITLRERLGRPRDAWCWAILAVLYPVWGFFQQAGVFLVLLLLRRWLPPEWLPWAPVITALAFAALHQPNYHLMFTVGFMVSLFIVHMDLHHNLAALALAHGVLATLWRLFPPPAVSTSLSVWGWYARTQRELQRDADRLGATGSRWTRPPDFPWARLVARWRW